MVTPGKQRTGHRRSNAIGIANDKNLRCHESQVVNESDGENSILASLNPDMKDPVRKEGL
jgi:hypothetical protein